MNKIAEGYIPSLMHNDEIVKTIAECNYGIWSVIAQTAISQNRQEVFMSLLNDFITQNYSGAINVFGKDLVNKIYTPH